MAFLALTASGVSLAAPARLAVRCNSSFQAAGNSTSSAPSSVSIRPAVFSDEGAASLLSSTPLPALSFFPASFEAPLGGLANVMYADNTFNTQILVGETESTESVVRRFKKVCMDANIVNECRRRRYFETSQDIIKRKQKDAARKRKRFQRSGGPRPNFYANKDKAEPEKATASADNDDDAEWSAMTI